ITHLQAYAVKHDHNDTVAMSQRGNCDGVARCRNVTGLKSVAAFDMTQQMVVGAHDHRLPGYFRAKRPFKSGGVTERVGVLEQLAAQDRQVTRGGDVVVLSLSRRQSMDGVKDGA